MRHLLQTVRDRFHPLHYARRSKVGRLAMRAIDRPAWVSLPDVTFKVRGQLLSHGVTYGAGVQVEQSIVLECAKRFGFKSMWDVGANFGYYSWLLKSVAPDLRITLVEPLPMNAEMIRRTIIRNNFADVELVEAAASDHFGEGVLHADMISGATSSLCDDESFVQAQFGIAPKKIPIRLVPLDSLKAKVDFVKIDVEGHEAAALMGAAETISCYQPVILIECCHPGRTCLAPLEAQGYRIVAVHPSNLLCIPPKLDYRWAEGCAENSCKGGAG